jgi:hypothetical protein
MTTRKQDDYWEVDQALKNYKTPRDQLKHYRVIRRNTIEKLEYFYNRFRNGRMKKEIFDHHVSIKISMANVANWDVMAWTDMVKESKDTLIRLKNQFEKRYDVTFENDVVGIVSD